jgi:hypothetical protein
MGRNFAGGIAMMSRPVAFAFALLLAGCASRSQETARNFDKVFEENDRSPSTSSGWCSRCNMDVYGGHRCGLTFPCQLCRNEAGARHLHEVQWSCDRCQVIMAKHHECRDAKTCTTCRQDKRNLLGSIGCERCFRQVPPSKLQGITAYCATCNLETGANHIHGKTKYCMNCLRESGTGHKCDATRLCMSHEREEAPDHVCGTTQYCDRCHRDCGVDHKHGETEWCWRCTAEVAWPHCHHH